MASTREDTPKPSLVYNSRVENIEDEEAAMAEERLRFAAAMEKWKAQEAELEAGKSLTLCLSLSFPPSYLCLFVCFLLKLNSLLLSLTMSVFFLIHYFDHCLQH